MNISMEHRSEEIYFGISSDGKEGGSDGKEGSKDADIFSAIFDDMDVEDVEFFF